LLGSTIKLFSICIFRVDKTINIQLMWSQSFKVSVSNLNSKFLLILFKSLSYIGLIMKNQRISLYVPRPFWPFNDFDHLHERSMINIHRLGRVSTISWHFSDVFDRLWSFLRSLDVQKRTKICPRFKNESIF